jgi:hypothetical protein
MPFCGDVDFVRVEVQGNFSDVAMDGRSGAPSYKSEITPSARLRVLRPTPLWNAEGRAGDFWHVYKDPRRRRFCVDDLGAEPGQGFLRGWGGKCTRNCDRVRAFMLICMLACYLTCHLRYALAELSDKALSAATMLLLP